MRVRRVVDTGRLREGCRAQHGWPRGKRQRASVWSDPDTGTLRLANYQVEGAVRYFFWPRFSSWLRTDAASFTASFGVALPSRSTLDAVVETGLDDCFLAMVCP